MKRAVDGRQRETHKQQVTRLRQERLTNPAGNILLAIKQFRDRVLADSFEWQCIATMMERLDNAREMQAHDAVAVFEEGIEEMIRDAGPLPVISKEQMVEAIDELRRTLDIEYAKYAAAAGATPIQRRRLDPDTPDNCRVEMSCERAAKYVTRKKSARGEDFRANYLDRGRVRADDIPGKPRLLVFDRRDLDRLREEYATGKRV